MAVFAAGEQQVADIGEGNQQHEPDGAHQNPELGPDVSHVPGGQRGGDRGGRSLAGSSHDFLVHPRHVTHGHVQLYAFAEPAKGRGPEAAVPVVPGKSGDGGHGDIELDLRVGEPGVRREDAGHRVGFAAQGEGLTEDCGVSPEAALPE